MYTEKDFETVKDIILKDVPAVSGIILFGSYARGTAKEDSDIDFLILINREYERKEKLKILADLRWDIALAGYNADVLLKYQKKHTADMLSPTLSRVINREGKIIWQK
jgi:predicted nucleotidyltransferase